MQFEKLFDNKDLPKALIRWGIAIVFFYFGYSQITKPTDWAGLVPEFFTKFISASDLVFYNGIFEVTFATLLILGIYTRIISFILAVHLAGISINLGMAPSGVRDFGLTVTTFVIFLNGTDKYCLENMWR